MDLQDGETLVWSKRANWTRGQRAVGGKLFLTDRRLIFLPHGVERLISGEGVEAALQEIGTVGIEPRGRGLFTGALRERLRVELDDGTEYLFVVGSLKGVVERLTAAAEAV